MPKTDTRTRDQRLRDLVDQGDPMAVALDEMGAWREGHYQNHDGTWVVQEFSWPQSPGALALTKALGLVDDAAETPADAPAEEKPDGA